MDIILRIAFTIPIVFGVIGCSRINAQEADIPQYDHVIILAFDGWGASSFDSASMPFLKSKIAASAWTMHKRSVLPTSSACNWASMFKGAGPEAHGYIDWNTYEPAFDIVFADHKGQFPSLFSLYRNHFPSIEMGYFYQWEGMKYIFDLDDFNHTEQFAVTVKGSDKMRDAAVKYILDKKPGLAVFFWDFPDATGHKKGWYSNEYMDELRHIDSIIETIVKACEKSEMIERTLFVITSDHGGHNQTHGQPLMSDLETPILLFGKNIVPGEIKEPVMQYDVATILADYLHLDKPIAWRGKTPLGILNL